MITLNAQQVYALLDPSAIYFFVAKKIIHKLNMSKCRLEKGLMIGSHLGEMVDINEIYRGVMYKLKVKICK